MKLDKYDLYFFKQRIVSFLTLENIRFNRWLKKEFSVGTLVEDCSYHPSIVVEVDTELGSVSVISLVRPDRFFYKSCDPILCGLRKIDDKEAQEMIQSYMNHGEEGLYMKK